MALTKVTGDFIKDGVLTQTHLHSSHGITTAHIGEGSNLYFTNARVASYLSSNNYVSGTGTNNRLAIWNGTGVIDSDSDFYVDGDTIFTTNLEASGSLSVSGGGTFTGGITVSSPGSSFYTTFKSANDYVIGLKDSANTTQWWLKAFTNGSFALHEDSVGDKFTIAAGGNATFAGDLTVSGGDITLGGTGRIQGIDTVSANTDAANKLYVDNQVAGIVDSAPSTLDTLNELAAALGDDANFSTTVTNSIATKMPLAGGTFTGAVVGTSFSAPSGFINGSNGGIRIHSSGTKFFNITAANAARDGVMDIGASDARFKDLYLSGNITAGGNIIVGTNTVINTARQGFFASLQHSAAISFLNGSQGTTGSGAQGISVRHVFASGSYGTTPGQGDVWATSDMRAPIFYDYDNTARYIDPAGTSSIYQLGVNGQLSMLGNNIIVFGANTGWGKYLAIGGNANNSTSDRGSIGVTNGNLHIDAADGGYATYLNYYDGTGGVAFGSGASGVVAWMGSDGDLWKGSSDNSGSKYWHAGNDGPGSGLNADLLDGIGGDGYLRSNATDTATGALTFSNMSNHYNGHLYYDAYDANGNHYPHFYDGSNGNGVDINWRLYTGSTNSHTHLWNTTKARFVTRVESSVDMRAPVFYDINNTAYYAHLDDTGTSIRAAGTVHASLSNMSAYQLNGTYVMDSSRNLVNIAAITASGDFNVGGVRIVGDNDSADQGTAFIRSNGDYLVMNAADGEHVYLNWDTSNGGSGHVYVDHALYAKIFYDRHDTNYSCDPASTSVFNALTVGGNTVSGFSGTWMGANFAGTRFGGYNRNGGELAFLQDNPSSGKISVLVDGSFYAGENGGFWSIWSGNNYNNRVGIYGDSSGNLQIGTSASENVLRTNHGYIQMGPMNSSHAHIYTDRSNFYFNKQIQLLGGSLINQNDIRAGVFYDVNNTGYYIHADDNSNIYNLTVNDLTVNANIYGRSVNNAYSNLYKFGGLYFTWDSDSYGTNFDHSITSSYGGTYGDDITLNSYHRFRINIDSNNNNGVTTEAFEVGHNTTGTSNLLLKLDGNGHMTVGRSGMTTSQIKLLYNDHSSGAGWDTGIYIGPSGQLPNSSSFPTYTAAGGYGIQFQANSDGVFYGMKEYTSGHYRPFINWGDDSGDTPMEIAFNGTTKFTLSYDGINYATASHRAPIFYDSDNTGYYLNPASTSFISTLNMNGNIEIRRTDPTIFFRDTDHNSAMLHTNSNIFYILRGGNDTTSWSQVNGVWPLEINLTNNQATFGGSLHSVADARAPIFYDRNDTTYYVDPNATSLTNNHNIKGTINFPSSGGTTHGGSHRPAYGIYQEGGSWSSPFPDLVIAMHTGIKMGANTSYNGIRFYTDYNMATQVMSINNHADGVGSSNVYVNNSLQADSSLRSPIFYDSNNTTYYTNPAGVSLMSVIQVGASGYSNIWLGGQSGNYFRFHTNNSHTYFDGNVGDIHWRQGSSTRFIFYMTTANMTVNGTVTQYSDSRLKDNIITIDGALDKVNQLRGVYYNRTDINTSERQIGLVAQEVESIVPEVVHTANDELNTKSISYAQLNALLVEAIKEQQTIIDDLKSRIETLENQ